MLLGVTGGVATYKSVEIARLLKQKGYRVRVVMTEAAKAFVTPLLFQGITGERVSDSLFDPQAEAAMGHIELAKWADVLLLAPATANSIAKLTYGLGDDLLSTLCLATSAPIFVAPAMNQAMWHAAATQANIAICIKRGMTLLGPGEGEQACGDIGLGRMLEPQDIVEQLLGEKQEGSLTGKCVMVTAGPTQEPMDPVRYISNHSSGKMGYAIARAAHAAGARVTLISGPVALPAPEGVTVVPVITAQEMYEAVMEPVRDCDIFIGAAAVADFRPKKCADKKLAKGDVVVDLVANPDIVASVAKQYPGVYVIGFAAETHDVVNKAKEKLFAKGIDLIAANEVGVAGRGFHSDNNALIIVSSQDCELIELDTKDSVAQQLIENISKRYKNHAKATS